MDHEPEEDLDRRITVNHEPDQTLGKKKKVCRPTKVVKLNYSRTMMPIAWK